MGVIYALNYRVRVTQLVDAKPKGYWTIWGIPFTQKTIHLILEKGISATPEAGSVTTQTVKTGSKIEIIIEALRPYATAPLTGYQEWDAAMSDTCGCGFLWSFPCVGKILVWRIGEWSWTEQYKITVKKNATTIFGPEIFNVDWRAAPFSPLILMDGKIRIEPQGRFWQELPPTVDDWAVIRIVDHEGKTTPYYYAKWSDLNDFILSWQGGTKVTYGFPPDHLEKTHDLVPRGCWPGAPPMTASGLYSYMANPPQGACWSAVTFGAQYTDEKGFTFGWIADDLPQKAKYIPSDQIMGSLFQIVVDAELADTVIVVEGLSKPDIISCTIAKTEPTAGETVSVSVKVKNVGDPGNISIGAVADRGSVIGVPLSRHFDAGEEYTFSFLYYAGATAGPFTITITATAPGGSDTCTLTGETKPAPTGVVIPVTPPPPPPSQPTPQTPTIAIKLAEKPVEVPIWERPWFWAIIGVGAGALIAAVAVRPKKE